MEVSERVVGSLLARCIILIRRCY